MNTNINRIILGTAQFGMNYGINNVRGKIPYSEVLEISKFAYENGIDTLDTAYSYGESEEILGKAISNNSLKFNIISKLPNVENEKDVESIFYKTLERLKQKKIYGYLFHSFETFKNHEYIFDIFQKLKHSKKIEKIGFSLYYPSEIDYLFENNIDFDIVQIPYSIFDQRFENYFPLLKERDIEIHVRSVFLQGLFFKKPEELNGNFTSIKEEIKAINRISKNMDTTIASICLKFALMNRNIDKVVVGVDSIENLKENLQGIKEKITDNKYYYLLKDMKVDDEKIILPLNWE